jgi:Pyruvate/2-oxoacid:ferredoxin oxidoreductase delta subunit
MTKIKRKIIKIDEKKCDGCGLCIPSCPEGALQIVDTPKGPKARLVKENFCDGLGACLGDCPQDALNVVEEEVEKYDEEGVIAHIRKHTPEKLKQHLEHLKKHADELPKHHSHEVHGMSGCPGSKTTSWGDKKDTGSASKATIPSELRQWPVQLTLVNPSAPYFKDTDLLIAADCVPFAYADFHQEFLKGKSLIIGCPKLDDARAYIKKLTEIFKNSNIKSITIVHMEVPCCFGLNHIVKQALEDSKKNIPVKSAVVTIKGEK